MTQAASITGAEEVELVQAGLTRRASIDALLRIGSAVAAQVHTHAIADVSGLTAALAGKADASALDGKADVSQLAGKADVGPVFGSGLTSTMSAALVGRYGIGGGPLQELEIGSGFRVSGYRINVDGVDAAAAPVAGFCQKVGAHFLVKAVFAAGSLLVLGGVSLSGETIAYSTSAADYIVVGDPTSGAITAALGYTPASTTAVAAVEAVAGATGFAQQAAGRILAEVKHSAGGAILSGTDLAGQTVVLLEGQYVAAGAGRATIIANPASSYAGLPASPSLNQFLRGTHIRTPERVVMICAWGQSLALGGNSDPDDETFTTTALDPGFSLMFDMGPWPERGAVTALINLRNPSKTEPSGGIGRTAVTETLGPRMFNVVQQRLFAALGQYQRMIWSVAGAGGAPIYMLKRGTPVYAELLRLVERGAALSKSQLGAQMYLPGIVVVHGEADGFCPPGRYARDLVRLRQDIDEDVRAITGQVEPVRLLLTQPVRGSSSAALEVGTPNGMLLASDIDPYCVVLGPKLHGRWNAAVDGTHPLAVGYAHLAETYGHALTDLLFGRGWVPTRVEEAYWISSTVLQLQYSRPVVLDTSGASLPTAGVDNLGFDIVQRAGKDETNYAGTAMTISSVAAVASAVTASVSGSVVTLAGSSRLPWGVTVRVGGVAHDVQAGQNDTLADVATVLAARISGATASGDTVTVPAGPTVTASVASVLVNITVSAAPTTMPRLCYGVRGAGKGLVRGFETLGLSAIPGNPPLHHWAVTEIRDVPVS
jgi:hypothetical protein